NTDMLLEPRLLMPANPSTAYLQTDEGADMIEKVAEKAKHRFRRKLKTSEAIAGHLLDTRPVQEPRLNYRRLKNAFYQSDSDLFTFVLNYSYKQDMSFDEKVSVFCKIALLFEDEMDFTGHVEVYEKTRYAIIFPFRKEKKKAVFRIEATA
ncbi:MAG: hypothetical protein MI784_01790, partial [Cytophagales bacterium]|nr:hypothetical protein [Cytophagales bacterium]